MLISISANGIKIKGTVYNHVEESDKYSGILEEIGTLVFPRIMPDSHGRSVNYWVIEALSLHQQLCATVYHENTDSTSSPINADLQSSFKSREQQKLTIIRSAFLLAVDHY
ncbi:uncharacterized protein EAF02_011175 [Botrytis sinoallii]|uniref:uncharacterized protein n=1 Tax=Botrytis sinoallii TaxID=1463999 RepID=UPI00190066E5|nr:uncharacterized protein EAF02_011175 [Botrytis sinoallii]KAF7857808.1 hypothetical protein EAF02_011175 [Botrytis sinoallii]